MSPEGLRIGPQDRSYMPCRNIPAHPYDSASISPLSGSDLPAGWFD